MGFGGAALAAITGLKNNSRRGHQTNYFQKNHDKASGKSTGVPVIEISEEKRNAMRGQLIVENKRDEQKVMIIFMVLLIAVVTIAVYFLFF